MSQLKNQLRLMIPRLAKEANQLKDKEARSRWMKLRAIALSSKPIAKSCADHGCSEDYFNKWGQRLLKFRRLAGLFSKSRRPYRSPLKTKTRLEKKVLKVRRVEPYLGPERIANVVEKIYEEKVAPSTVYAILRRAKVVGKKIAEKLTKKHLKRYRRPLPGYLQMDFKYVPYLIEGKQYYQLSCIDHHSSWRLIRNYRNKNILCVMKFLKELDEHCPFPIVEIQTDNDKAFTDKFDSHGLGVTGQHELDQWCRSRGITHRLIPVGVKELNGKVENTHKQDDREFFAMNSFKTFESIELSTRGYNDRWNNHRVTKTLGWKTPNEVILEAYIKVLAVLWLIRSDLNKAVHNLNSQGDAFIAIPKPKKHPTKKIRTRKASITEKYLSYLEWDVSKKKLPMFFIYPTMSQNFSKSFSKHVVQNIFHPTQDVLFLSDCVRSAELLKSKFLLLVLYDCHEII